MHPIERLRYVARAGGAPPSLLVREAAGALAGFADDPAALVTSCRRLVDRHPQVGPMWWLASRMLAAPDPVIEAWRVADELDDDPTSATLAAHLGDSLTVVVVGWPELVGAALRHRGDLEVLVVDALGEGAGLARRLRTAGIEVSEVPESGLAPAVASAGLVLIEALAMGAPPGRGRPGLPTGAGAGAGAVLGAGAVGAGAVVGAGSWAAAAVAASVQVPTWMVAGAGRVLPGRLWAAMVGRLEGDADEPWDRAFEVMPLSLVDQVCGPDGLEAPAAALARADFPVVPELLRPMGG